MVFVKDVTLALKIGCFVDSGLEVGNAGHRHLLDFVVNYNYDRPIQQDKSYDIDHTQLSIPNLRFWV